MVRCSNSSTLLATQNETWSKRRWWLKVIAKIYYLGLKRSKLQQIQTWKWPLFHRVTFHVWLAPYLPTSSAQVQRPEMERKSTKLKKEQSALLFRATESKSKLAPRVKWYNCKLTSIFCFRAIEFKSLAAIPVYQSIPIVTPLLPGAWLFIRKHAM